MLVTMKDVFPILYGIFLHSMCYCPSVDGLSCTKQVTRDNSCYTNNIIYDYNLLLIIFNSFKFCHGTTKVIVTSVVSTTFNSSTGSLQIFKVTLELN